MAKRRRTVARHARLKSPHPFGQMLTVLGVVMAVVLVSGASVAAYTTYDLASSFTENAVDLPDQAAVPPDIGQIEGGVNLFLAGIDECEPEYAAAFGARCKGADAEGKLNDVNILVHISDAPRRVTVISFPRDLMVPIPSCTRENGSQTSAMSKAQINSAFMYGGLACVVKTVSQLSGQDIPFAATITFGGVIKITDALGGVDVCLATGIRDSYTGINWSAGIRNVQGMEALQFLRTRHGLNDGSDLARISNQQQYMSKLARKLVSEDVLSNPTTLYKLATVGLENVTPSKSLTNPLTLVQIALAVKGVPFEDIVFVQYPSVGDPADPNRVVPNTTAAKALWKALADNSSLQLSGSAGAGSIQETPAPTASAAPSGPATSSPAAPATPDPTAVATLPPSITGTTAAESTCTNGNLSK